MPTVNVYQASFFGENTAVNIRADSLVRQQVRDVLASEPELEGNVGAVVARVWRVFYDLESYVKAGVDSVEKFVAGEIPGVPNYKNISRRYHEVVKEQAERRS